MNIKYLTFSANNFHCISNIIHQCTKKNVPTGNYKNISAKTKNRVHRFTVDRKKLYYFGKYMLRK